MSEKHPVQSNIKPPAFNPGRITNFLLNYFPTLGQKRLNSQLQVGWLASQGYITPSSGKRSMRDWFPRGGSADVDTLPSLGSSRAGSRDMFMNTPIATAVLRRKNSNVVGSGLTLQSRIDREFLGLTEEQADEWERHTEREFKLWSQSKNCDASRTQTFKELQQLVFFNRMLSGDIFVVLPFRRLKNFPYAMTLQTIEGDQCQNPQDIDTYISSKTRAGIEVDDFGAPKFYWFRTKHPGDPDLEQKWVKIRAFGRRSGRRQVLHLFNKERPGQRRGMPELAPVMENLKQLTRLAESELMAAVISSYFTVFVKKTTNITEPLAPSFAPQNSVKSSENPQDDFSYEMGAGSIIGLAEDESIDIADPKRPNAAFEPFFQAIVKQIGAALEVPYELLMLTFNSSYSASRAAILEGWKTFKKERANFVSQFCQPVYEEFLAEAVARGRISAPGYLSDPLIRQAWAGSFWGGPGMGQIDPLKETRASIIKIKNNLSNYETETQDTNGGDWDASMDRKSREVNKLKEKGLFIELEDPEQEGSGTDEIEGDNA